MCTNETLAELGLLATVIFERLLMVADREGRFEWRLRKIQALIIPLLNVPVEIFDETMENLCKSGLICQYFHNSEMYGLIPNFTKHQHPHPRETTSKLPIPSVRDGQKNGHFHDLNTVKSANLGNDNLRHDLGHAKDMPRRSFPSIPSKDGEVVASSGDKKVTSETSPPQNRPEPEPKKPDFRTPTSHNHRERKPPTKPEPKPENGCSGSPGELPASRKTAPLNFWPHPPDAVLLMRQSLSALADAIRMPVPDDAIIRRTLDAARGAPAEQIHDTLRALWQRQKFRDMRSWGLVPVVVAGCFRAA